MKRKDGGFVKLVKEKERKKERKQEEAGKKETKRKTKKENAFKMQFAMILVLQIRVQTDFVFYIIKAGVCVLNSFEAMGYPRVPMASL